MPSSLGETMELTSVYTLVLLCTTVCLLWFAGVAWQQRRVPGALHCCVFTVAAAVWAGGYACEIQQPTLAAKLFWARVQYGGIVALPVAWWLFVCQVTGRQTWQGRGHVALLSIIPFVTLCLVWSDDWHGWIYRHVEIKQYHSVTVLHVTGGVGYWVNWLYAQALLLMSLFMVWAWRRRSTGLYRAHSTLLLVLACGPWVGNILHVFGVGAVLDLTPLGFAGSALGALWGVKELRMLEIAPMARDAVVEHLPDGVMILDTDGRIVDINPSACRILGRAVTVLLEEPITSACAHLPALLSLCDAPEHSSAPLCIGARQYSCRITALHDVTVNRRGRLVMLRDITEHTQHLQVSEATATVGNALIEALGTPHLLSELCRVTLRVFHCDMSHTFLFNTVRRDFSIVAGDGLSAEESAQLRALRIPFTLVEPLLKRQQNDGVIFVDCNAPEVEEATVLSRKFGVRNVFYLPLKRGEELVGSLSVAYRRALDPAEIPQYMQVARSVAHLASLAFVIDASIDELRVANDAKEDFLAGMSHELRTPLNIILGYADLLQEHVFGDLNQEQHDVIARTQHSAQQLLVLVNATLELSRADAEGLLLNVESCQVASLFEELERDVAVAFTLPDGIEVIWQHTAVIDTIDTDRLKLEMVLKNLVGNALKYTESGQVSITTKAADNGIVFSVTDTGIGISVDAVETIFEPFQQLGEISSAGGVGLGLYIARRLVDALGGKISVESQPGQGSTFHVWVPRQAPQRLAALSA